MPVDQSFERFASSLSAHRACAAEKKTDVPGDSPAINVLATASVQSQAPMRVTGQRSRANQYGARQQANKQWTVVGSVPVLAGCFFGRQRNWRSSSPE
ncbi:hypothetical protein [Pantoea sp. LMR881]|uniref:hypothetical protein n=1 Tax=Pantoea sp. LMR881 TaxID=3014336 RepID=UPI003FA7DD8B